MSLSLSSARGREAIASATCLKCLRVMWSASEGDVPRARVDAVLHSIRDVGLVNFVGQVRLKALNLLLQLAEAVRERASLVFQSLGGHGGESLIDGISHDGDESLLEGVCESL